MSRNLSDNELEQLVNDTWYISIGKHKQTGKFHALLFRIEQLASGNQNHILQYSVPTGFDTQIEAAKNANEVFPNIRFSNIYAELMGLPADCLRHLHQISTTPEQKAKHKSTQKRKGNPNEKNRN